uniref:Transposase n=1 Tax=Ditylenchus dipsaci TaxID=166011 RepID=A0A915DHL5_9BILA
MQSQSERQKKRGIAREWMTVKECSSKEDTDKWISASQTLIAHWNQKWNEHRRIMGDLHEFHQSWLLREDYNGWFYRFASSIGVGMSSLPTNNGLEGTNNMLKKEYTQRELIGITRFLLLDEQYIHDCSVDQERKL